VTVDSEQARVGGTDSLSKLRALAEQAQLSRFSLIFAALPMRSRR